MESTGHTYVICMLLAKLPAHTRDKSTRRMLRKRRRQMREPDLVDFIELAKDETLLVNYHYSESQKLISIVTNHQKAHNKIPSIKQAS